MKFSFSMTSLSLSPEGDEAMMESEIALGLLADELGYDMVKMGERHFSGLGGGNPLQMLAALAPRLKHAWVGTGVTVVPDHHPVRLAEQINILDHLAKGKSLVGLGSGMSPEDAAAFGFDVRDQNRLMFDEGVEALLRLWAKRSNDPPVPVDTRYHKGTLLERICPSPYRKDQPYLKTTASSPQHIERAARNGWPVYLMGRDAEEVRPTFERYRAAVAARSHPDDVLDHCARWTSVVTLAMHIAETDALAAEEAAYLDRGIESLIERKQLLGSQAKRLQGVEDELPGATRRGREFREHMRIVGGPETIAGHVGALADLGLGLFQVAFTGPSDEAGGILVRKALRLFAEQIIPRFRDRAVPRYAPSGDTDINASIGSIA